MKSTHVFKKMEARFLIFFLLQALMLNLFAQTDLDKFKEIIKEDSTLINGLANYDVAVRTDILIVAQHPEVLEELKEKQQNAQLAFQNIISDYDRDTQFGIYELSRYPDLLKELTIEGKLRKREIENVILSYPEDIHEVALEYGRKRYKALAAIENLNEKNSNDFAVLIGKYDEEFQNSIKRLIDTPEILSTLSENSEFTRLAGSVNKQYPERMAAYLEVKHNEIKARKAQELADYQEKLKGDPEAYDEMLAAAEQFASEEMVNKNITDPVTKEVEVVHVNHYSYWYGYPHWYSYPYWRPYPWYYHTGFYYGPRGVVFIGMPSYWYVGWHHRYYPNRYPHLSYHYYRHGHRHPRSYYNFNRTVNVNINNNINVDRGNLAKIDHNRGNIIPKQWPNERPAARPDVRPDQRPSTRPEARPSTRPSTRPSQQPSQRPATKPATPSTRPATRPSPPVNYNNYRSNESFRQNWSRPSTPATRPATRPAARPSGGFRRR
ncbi:DUF3300 domain-containing protein [Carboxylicivirga marina]|uniref:DUF3300 domain-containing protein n=1 Tax=Carboxylicivirga marina TaxID=2800988 RepID=A0ABS1HKX6_9BACT|nr:DUF3300 domain-containing protein [Carboxylicivirga marina]MBK3518322.1 hypothetical protein [Carboxylicivirga marina]